ncbi:hypothetical protein SLU01_35600 [Sporosarcina luteola]|uniref:Uncharacterized protein n=1 Tax=Sporosarcina luteola TaxID=582850 RepID=A0A511ZCT5_9BACL|nr:hypothetical protein [Sporosarcina luteola]GEN85248.1 hypothetical protein SLU01_35600 [Sporosarcina luteola]
MFGKMKRITALSLSALLFLIGSSVYAAEEDNDNIHYPHSIDLIEGNGNPVEKLKLVDEDDEVSAQSTFVVYENNGYAGNPRGMSTGFNNKYMLFHNASVSIPSGVNTTYTWERTITKINTTSNTFEVGARGQGGVKFLTELEAHIKNAYTSTETVSISQGTKSATQITQPGYYNLNFYLKSQTYDLYGDWWGYTRDQPNVRKKVDRYLGQVQEATGYMHLEVTKTGN